MRVALNVEQLLQRPPGGIGRYTAELARLLPQSSESGPGLRDGDAVELVPFVARHRHQTIEAALGRFGLTGLDPVRLVLPRPLLYDTWNLLGAPPLGLLHRSLRDIDLIHAPSLAVPPASGVPIIVTAHDAAALAFPETYTRRGRWFHERGSIAAAKRAEIVIAPTVAAAEEITSHTPIPMEKIRIVPHGVAQITVGDGLVAATRATLGVGDDPYVLWVGTLEPRKNLPVLIGAFGAVVRASGLPHRLVIVGSSGWLDTADAIREPARALGDRICFTGPIRADRLVALYHGAELLAFPSLHEGFGLPVLEAMAQETAVLASDIPVLREVGGDAARYLPPSDVAAWGDALVELLRDDAERGRMARAGHDRADGFTWERCIERTKAVYREVLGN
jgi:glycosyltransferase involved in cell wall biosynthesis